MKRLKPILILSLAANIALLALVVYSGSKATAVQRSSATTTSSKNVHAQAASQDITATTAKTYTLSQNLWRDLYTDDLLTLVRRLKAAGFPAKLAQRIVWDLNRARAETARAAIQGLPEDTPYWKERPYYPDDPAARTKIREINQKQNEVYLKLMLEVEPQAEDDESAYYLRQQFGNLPLEKLQQTSKITADYRELRYNLSVAARAKNPSGDLTDADRAQLATLAQEEQHDLKQALTPEEYAEYLYRSSPTANRLRDQLDVFRPTEEEYKNIFALQRSIDEQFQLTNYSSATNQSQAYKDAMKALEPQIKAALGDERYAEYLQAMDQTNNKLKRLVARLDLPLTTVSKILDVQTDITQRAEAIQKDQTLTETERANQTLQLTQEAQTRLTASLGEHGYNAYAENKGSWLRTLREQAARGKP